MTMRQVPNGASSPVERVDIAIAGAGIVGLAAALALTQVGGPTLGIAVCDPMLAEGRMPKPGLRAVAITPASRHLLDSLGVWSAVAPTAEPLLSMVLTDSRPGAVPAPDFLHFKNPAGDDEPLAHITLQDELRAALIAACAAHGVRLRSWPITTVAAAGTTALACSGAEGTLHARLLVAADGGRSRLRDAAGIKTVGWDYDQASIVATIAHSHDHGGEAIQHFLPGGPLALLPMRDAEGGRLRSSIVWTERRDTVDRLLALEPAAFCAALSDHGGFERGALRLEDTPAALTLRLRVARSLAAPRLALVGDAARTIHPLAGQGLNLGLQDVAALVRRVEEATALGLDPGAPRVLDAYQHDRRAGQVAMAGATEALNRLFSNDHGPVRLVRDLGLGLVDRSPAFKRWLTREASGLG